MDDAIPSLKLNHIKKLGGRSTASKSLTDSAKYMNLKTQEYNLM